MVSELTCHVELLLMLRWRMHVSFPAALSPPQCAVSSGYGSLKLDIKTKTKSGVVSIAVTSDPRVSTALCSLDPIADSQTRSTSD